MDFPNQPRCFYSKILVDFSVCISKKLSGNEAIKLISKE